MTASTKISLIILNVSIITTTMLQLTLAFQQSIQKTHIQSSHHLTSSIFIGSKQRLVSPTPLSKTTLHGIDFESIFDDEECDFTDGDLSNIDLSKCLPFPSPNIEPEDVVTLCMEALTNNDDPKVNAGLEVCFNFSSDRCRAANGGTLESFLQYANNPTFRSMVNAREWKTLNVGPEMSPGQGSVTTTGLGTTRGAMKTILISVIPRDINLHERKFLWTMQKERRPPLQGCWLVHECLFVDNALREFDAE